MTAVRFLIALNILAGCWLITGIVGFIWEIEVLKLSRFSIFGICLLFVASGFVWWVKAQERQQEPHQ